MAILTSSFKASTRSGMDERWLQPSSSATLIQNMQWNQRGGWETVGGYYPILQKADEGTSRYAGSSTIQSVYWFSRHNGAQQFLLYEDGGNLRMFVGSFSVYWDTLETGRYFPAFPWQHTQYAAWGNWCYIINGVNEPKRFDGRKYLRCGFDAPPGPPTVYGPNTGFTVATATDGLGLGAPGDAMVDAISRYRYACTWVDDIGNESPLSPLSDEVAWEIASGAGTAGNRYFTALDIPNGPPNTVAVRIYRTMNYEGEPVGSGQVLYFLRELNYNIKDVWVDTIPDDALGSEVDPSQFGAWPKGAKYIAFFKGTCFLAGMPEYPDRVVWSRAGQPSNFPPDNFLPFGDLDSSEITGMRATKNSLVVFKRRGVYIIKGDQINGFTGHTLTEDVGACAPNAFADLPGKGLMFVSERGVYLLIGAHEQGEEVTRAVPMFGNGEEAGGVMETWKDVNIHGIQTAPGAFYHDKKEYWLAVPKMGQLKNNLVFIYHYDTGAWSTRPGLPISCLTETRDHRGYLIFGSHDTTSHPGLHVWSQGWPDFDGTAPTCFYETCEIDFGRMYESVSVQSIYSHVIGYGGTLAVDYYVDHRIALERAQNGDGAMSLTQQDPSMEYDVWGEGTWGDGTTWCQWRPIVLRYDVHFPQEACRTIRFRLTPASGTRAQLLGYDVEITRGRERDVKPLNTLISPQVP